MTNSFKFFRLLGLVLLLGLPFTSCSSDDDSSDNTNNTGYYINFKLNGEQINITGEDNVYVANTLAKGIIGDDVTNQHFIRLFVPLDVTTGTFIITGSVADDYTATYTDGEFSTDNESGTITITEVNADVIRGTFSFTGEFNGENMSITDGEFRANNVE